MSASSGYLGVNCTASWTNLALAAGGELLHVEPGRYALPSGEVSVRLNGFYEETERILADILPVKVILLEAGTNPRARPAVAKIEARVAMETLVRLAAVRAGAEVEMLGRKALRSRLGIDQKGDLADHVDEVTEPQGHHWNEGRHLAALAALAGEKS
jgi:hypothetical protein